MPVCLDFFRCRVSLRNEIRSVLFSRHNESGGWRRKFHNVVSQLLTFDMADVEDDDLFSNINGRPTSQLEKIVVRQERPDCIRRSFRRRRSPWPRAS